MFSTDDVMTSCSERSTRQPWPDSRAAWTPVRPQMHAINEPNVRFWRPHAPTACSGVPEMLSTPLSAPATRSLVCHPERGPVRPKGVSETCTRPGLAAGDVVAIDAELGEATGRLGLDDQEAGAPLP